MRLKISEKDLILLSVPFMQNGTSIFPYAKIFLIKEVHYKARYLSFNTGTSR